MTMENPNHEWVDVSPIQKKVRRWFSSNRLVFFWGGEGGKTRGFVQAEFEFTHQGYDPVPTLRRSKTLQNWAPRRKADAQEDIHGVTSSDLEGPWYLLMVQKSGVHQLRLVVYPIISRFSFTSQVVVWDFSHQQYGQWNIIHEGSMGTRTHIYLDMNGIKFMVHVGKYYMDLLGNQFNCQTF